MRKRPSLVVSCDFILANRFFIRDDFTTLVLRLPHDLGAVVSTEVEEAIYGRSDLSWVFSMALLVLIDKKKSKYNLIQFKSLTYMMKFLLGRAVLPFS